VSAGSGDRLENVSSNGITTEIVFITHLQQKKNIKPDIEKRMKKKMEDLKEGDK
jgi:hypothetical protein